MLGEQDLGLVGPGRPEIREMVVRQVGDVDTGVVQSGDRPGVTAEFEAAMDDRAVLD